MEKSSGLPYLGQQFHLMRAGYGDAACVGADDCSGYNVPTMGGSLRRLAARPVSSPDYYNYYQVTRNTHGSIKIFIDKNFNENK
jgi:hypothetical protein